MKNLLNSIISKKHYLLNRYSIFIINGFALAASLFFLGRNSRGQWVAQDQSGRRGGLFVSQAAALKYALFENGRKPELVVNMPGVF